MLRNMKLRLYPDEILYEESESVKEFNGELAGLVADMIETMHTGRGIGLAGIQVGIPQRLFVTHVADDEPRVFINPIITGTSIEEVDYEEGCLSIPGVYADVKRPSGVEIQAYNEKGRPFRMETSGMLARVIQHEFDHLNGVLFLQYLTDRKRERLVNAYLRRNPAATANA